MKTITIPEMKVSYRIYRDPSYSERFPWVFEIDGEVYNTYADKGYIEDRVATIIRDYYFWPKVYEALKEAA